MTLEGLEALRARFRARARDDAASIRDWQAAGRPADEAVERTIHNIAGAAGTFSLQDLHEAAATVDDAFALGRPVTAEAVDALLEAIDALEP